MNKRVMIETIIGVLAVLVAAHVFLYIVSFLIFCVQVYIDSYATFKGVIG